MPVPNNQTMLLPHFLALSAWSMAIAIAWSTRWERETAIPVPALVGWALLLTATGMWGLWASPPTVWIPNAFLACAALVAGFLWLRSSEQARRLRWKAESREMAWIIQQRGSVQDQIMRACEQEAMERRLRRCQSTLMLTRRGGEDLSVLFRRLESRVAAMQTEPMEAASVVGAFAAHLRHVFMESDRDDITVAEACSHVDRWANVLGALGAPPIAIVGAPLSSDAIARRRVPAMLILGATERLGVCALEQPEPQPTQWEWTFEDHTVRLSSHGGATLVLPSDELKDWDAAFMLRHGGIAHAGGIWSFELPLLPA